MAAPSSLPARVLLVGFQDQENLGLRYLVSSLGAHGHVARLVDIKNGPEFVLAEAQAFRPHVVGFSLIFQYLVPQFASLAEQLRQAGVTAHFTMGGHYPSLEPAFLFSVISELDSIVLFEGEDTLPELAGRVAAGQSWHDLPGLFVHTPQGDFVTAARRGRHDLDELPWPDRNDIDYLRQPLPTAAILGGRGCTMKCNFCSIVRFYTGNGTPGRRRRNPQLVVDEIEFLHRQRGVRILLWQDDDFLCGGTRGIAWAHSLAHECITRGLHTHLRWKISCRSDEVTEASLAPLVEAGLSHVYLGVEAGNPVDLVHLNKNLNPEDHLVAAATLSKLGLSFDYGFMLLQPWSTLESAITNVDFLRKFLAGGLSPVVFCRTLPYAGTVMAERLAAEGRLLQKDGAPDYRFLDLRLDVFYDWLLGVFVEHNFNSSGTAKWLRSLLFIASLDLPDYPRDGILLERLQILTEVSNQVVLDTLASVLEYISRKEIVSPDDPVLVGLAVHAAAEDQRLRKDILTMLSARPNGALRAYFRHRGIESV